MLFFVKRIQPFVIFQPCKIHLHIMDPSGKALKFIHAVGKTGILLDPSCSLLAITGMIIVSASDDHNGEVLFQLTLRLQIIQCRQQLAKGQIAGSPEYGKGQLLHAHRLHSW